MQDVLVVYKEPEVAIAGVSAGIVASVSTPQ
jgi:hypothetical protein